MLRFSLALSRLASSDFTTLPFFLCLLSFSFLPFSSSSPFVCFLMACILFSKVWLRKRAHFFVVLIMRASMASRELDELNILQKKSPVSTCAILGMDGHVLTVPLSGSTSAPAFQILDIARRLVPCTSAVFWIAPWGNRSFSTIDCNIQNAHLRSALFNSLLSIAWGGGSSS